MCSTVCGRGTELFRLRHGARLTNPEMVLGTHKHLCKYKWWLSEPHLDSESVSRYRCRRMLRCDMNFPKSGRNSDSPAHLVELQLSQNRLGNRN